MPAGVGPARLPQQRLGERPRPRVGLSEGCQGIGPLVLLVAMRPDHQLRIAQERPSLLRLCSILLLEESEGISCWKPKGYRTRYHSPFRVGDGASPPLERRREERCFE